MARIFKYAQAGIISVLDDPTGKRPIIQYDDNPEGLVGKSLSIYLHPDPKKPQYNKISNDPAPVAGKYEHMTFTEDAVNGIKAGAEKRLKAYLAKTPVVPTTETTTQNADIPF